MNVIVLGKPVKCPLFDLRLNLADEGGISHGKNNPLAQFAMEGSDHLGLTMGSASHRIGGGQSTNGIGARLLIGEAYQIAGVEVDHRISRSRS